MNNISNILSPPNINQIIEEWLKEDIPNFDYGSCLFGLQRTVAVILMKDKGVIAGIPFVNAAIKEMNCEIEWYKQEGEFVESVPLKLATVKGLTREVLRVERLCLNILTRACGIATLTKRMIESLSSVNWNGIVAGTRRTTPGFRLVEKYAILVGGGCPHRYDLSSMIMLKDYHYQAAGSITNAVELSKRVAGFSMKIESQCANMDEAKEAAKAGADVIRLDGLNASNVKDISKYIKSNHPDILVESSGDYNLDTVKLFASSDVDILACRMLSQGYPTLDLSMKILPPNTKLT